MRGERRAICKDNCRQCEVSFKNCTFYSLALKDVYIKHFYDLLAFYWHLADCRSIVVLAPITHFALLSAQYKSQNLIKQFIKSNLCQCKGIFCLGWNKRLVASNPNKWRCQQVYKSLFICFIHNNRRKVTFYDCYCIWFDINLEENLLCFVFAFDYVDAVHW